MLSRSITYNNYDCYLYCINYVISIYEPKMIKINLHKDLSDFSPFRRYPRKRAFFLLISCTSQMSIIFFLIEEMLRHMKINVSFGPSSGTDMSNFRPWLMDYNVWFAEWWSNVDKLAIRHIYICVLVSTFDSQFIKLISFFSHYFQSLPVFPNSVWFQTNQYDK